MTRRNSKKRMGILLVSGLVVLFTLLIFGMSCYQSAPAPAPTPAPAPSPTPTITEVKISGFTFIPAIVTVSAGSTVTWTNQDSAPHTVTSETDLFDSGRLSINDSSSYTFTDRGTFSYYCKIHPSMRGKVIVE